MNIWHLISNNTQTLVAIAITLIARDLLSFVLSKIGMLEKSTFGCAIHTLLILSAIALTIPTLLLFLFWQTLVEEARQGKATEKMGELLKVFSDGWSKEKSPKHGEKP